MRTRVIFLVRKTMVSVKQNWVLHHFTIHIATFSVTRGSYISNNGTDGWGSGPELPDSSKADIRVLP